MILGNSCKWNHTVFVLLCIWLISLSIVAPRFIHVVAWVRISFLLKAAKYSIVYTYSFFFLIHSFVYRHLGCFNSLAVVNYAVMNMGYKYLFETLLSALLGIYPEVELLGHINSVCDFFEEPSYCLPQQLHHFISHHQCTRAAISPHSCQHLFCFLDSGHPNGWEVYSCFYR